MAVRFFSLLASAVLVSAALAGATGVRERAPGFAGDSRPLRGEVRDRVAGSSWERGCPVGLGRLRLLEFHHWGFDSEPHRGRLIVHRNHDREILRVFHRLYRARFPIRRIELIDRYGADDHRSMNADNSSGFNCRFVAGTTRWSEHAYGRAVDINPIENPYVSGSHVSPSAGRPYVDRSRNAEGMIGDGDVVVRAFASAGWEWGGAWPGATRDYQHFSATGR